MRPPIRDKRRAIWIGGVLTLVGFWILYGAWEGRGGKKPFPLGLVLPW